MSQLLNRYRGVVLTPQGLKRLKESIVLAQEQEKFGSRFTQVELSERAKLSTKTIKKIQEGKIPTDETSVRALFSAFSLVLETADYGQPEPSPSTPDANPPSRNTSSTPKIDWGEKPDTALFFGRTAELATLNLWVQGDQCRLITLLGMGGIGKTSLAAKLANQVYDRFDYVIWRSLREAPPLDEILVRLIQFLSDQQETEINLPTRLGERIIRLLHYLREYRCLVVLDNLESILQAETAGRYRDGYEGYGELIQRIGSTEHQSCLLLTSRECSRELAPLTGNNLPVRQWSVGGIDTEAGRELLRSKDLELDEMDIQGDELIRRYSGNPQALHLVATAIQKEFFGDVNDFLQEHGTVVDDVQSLLDQHLSRLAPLERSVLFWLAINREPVGLDELMEDLLPPVTKQEVRGALRGLSDRYLIETVGKQVTLQNVIMEFTTSSFIENIVLEIRGQQIRLFHSHALIKAAAKDYVRETQVRLILQPISKPLLKEEVVNSLKIIRENNSLHNGYASGNLLNLLCQTGLQTHDLDFSSLTLRQVYLIGAKLYSANLSNTILIKPSLTENFGRINSISISPKGDLLAAGDSNGCIQVWQINNHQLMLALHGHSNEVTSICFSPDNRFIASCSGDNTVRLWNIEKGQCEYVFEGHSNWIWDLAFSSNGNFIGSCSADSTIRIWNVQEKKCSHVLQENSNCFRAVAFSPDNRFLASTTDDFKIWIWDLHKNERVHLLEGHDNWIWSLSFSSDGRFLVSGGDDFTIRVWDVEGQNFFCVYEGQGHTSWVWTVAFSPDSRFIASGSDDSTIRIWDVEEKKCVHILLGHTNWVRSVSFSPDSKFLASGSDDSTIRIWDIEKQQHPYSLAGYTNWVWSISFSINGKFLASGNGDTIIRLWDIQKRQYTHTFEGHKRWIGSVDFSPDNHLLVSGSADGTIRLWDINKQECLHVFLGHSNWVRTVVFSPDGYLIASGSADSTIRIWDIKNKQCLITLSGHTKEIRSIAFSPNGHFLASGSEDSTIRIWDLQKESIFHELEGHVDWVGSVAFSPDGQFLASGSGDAKIRLWDLKRSQCSHIFENHNNWVWAVAFSPDGQFLASGSEDSKIRLWNVHSKQCDQIFEGHVGRVRSVAFSPDGQSLASGSNDGTIRLWNVHSGDCLEIMQSPRPFEDTNIFGIRGLTEAQIASLIALGAKNSH